LAPGTIAHKCGSDGIQEILLTKRLGQKLNSSGLHGLDRHGNVAVAGNKDDWDIDVGVSKFCLKIQSTHSGQPDIEHQPTRNVWKLARKKFRRCCIRLNLQAHRSKKSRERLAQ